MSQVEPGTNTKIFSAWVGEPGVNERITFYTPYIIVNKTGQNVCFKEEGASGAGDVFDAVQVYFILFYFLCFIFIYFHLLCTYYFTHAADVPRRICRRNTIFILERNASERNASWPIWFATFQIQNWH